ncbi:MAG: KAP family P-loop NTPase fold protein, partial [Fusobacteriaceae bacterium]
MSDFDEEKFKKIYKEDKNLFNRTAEIKTLLDVIKNNSDIKVLSINSSWGTGKTTFIKMWEKYINENEAQNFLPLYFNAWENDDSKKPLMSLLLEFGEEFNKVVECKNIVKIGNALLEHSPQAIFNFVKSIPTINWLGVAGEEISNLAKKTIDEVNETGVEKLFRDIPEYQIEKVRKEAKEQFKKLLKIFQEKNKKQIMIFVDELDRCRPTYAIEMLETIKHYFGSENYIFVLSLDKVQLSHSIATIYGQNMDSAGYLTRFIDLEYTLKKVDTGIYFEKILKEAGHNIIEIPLSTNILKFFINVFDFSLRDIDKLFYGGTLTHFFDIDPHSRHYNYVESGFRLYINILFFSLRIKEPLIYYGYINKTLSDDELLKINFRMDTYTKDYFDYWKNNSDNFNTGKID